MMIFSIGLTDGTGDSSYGVALNMEAATWEDKSGAGHEISSITQGGNVSATGGGLACEDTAGGTALMLNGASWTMVERANGGAYRQHDPGGTVEQDWTWEVTSVTKN